MLIVLITYTDDSTDIKYCFEIEEISLCGVKELKILRDERTKVA